MRRRGRRELRRYPGRSTQLWQSLYPFIVSVCIIVVLLLSVFANTGIELPVVEAASLQYSSSQSAASTLYAYTLVQRDANDGTSTSADVSQAYIDASGSVATYNAALVSSDKFAVALNSPTQQLTEAAYVVNLTYLLAQEFNDIQKFEESLGVTGHVGVDDYVLEKLQMGNATLVSSGLNSSAQLRGCVGPAVVIRDFYTTGAWADDCTNSSNFFSSFGYGATDGYIDLMLVRDELVTAYLTGQDVDVYYVQLYIGAGDCKAHTAPWGLTQTYLAFNGDGTMLCNETSGGFTTQSSSNTIDITGDATADLAGLLSKLREQTLKAYWWPTLEATNAQLGVNFTTEVSTYPVTSYTGNILELPNSSATEAFTSTFSGYSIVGLLVYATQ